MKENANIASWGDGQPSFVPKTPSGVPSSRGTTRAFWGSESSTSSYAYYTADDLLRCLTVHNVVYIGYIHQAATNTLDAWGTHWH